MAATVRRTDPSLRDVLARDPWNFSFFQAVRLLAWMYPEARVVSAFQQPHGEIVRFQAHQSMLFPASEIQHLETSADGVVHMTVNFMGLTGPKGVLPEHYTEYLIGRSYVGDRTAATFFDIFNHRLLSLFYLAWEKHHFPIAFEREHLHPELPQRFTQYLFDLIGMGTPGLRDRSALPDEVLLSYGGLIAQRPHSSLALAGLLMDYFQSPIEIRQFVGEWQQLDTDSLSYLDGGGIHGQLGLGAVAGDQVWNPQARFRIRVGALGWKRYNQFLPGGSAFGSLVAVTRFFVNQALDFEVQLLLRAAEVPFCDLEGEPGSPRLGLSSWLKTGPFREDAGDLVLAVRGAEKTEAKTG